MKRTYTTISIKVKKTIKEGKSRKGGRGGKKPNFP
jgi:hypothetical protein